MEHEGREIPRILISGDKDGWEGRKEQEITGQVQQNLRPREVSPRGPRVVVLEVELLPDGLEFEPPARRFQI